MTNSKEKKKTEKKIRNQLGSFYCAFFPILKSIKIEPKQRPQVDRLNPNSDLTSSWRRVELLSLQTVAKWHSKLVNLISEPSVVLAELAANKHKIAECSRLIRQNLAQRRRRRRRRRQVQQQQQEDASPD